ncbi:hypothetical protein L7F22_025260 [Adiantum nelumboides]|nr:hypothetical protein [Adiantum nelumboides]
MISPSTLYRGSVGAGFEGWMKDAPLLAMSTQLLAMARPRAVMIIKCRTPGDAHLSPAITISLPQSEQGHHITIIQWLVFTNWSILTIGTSLGSVLFFSTKGSLLLRQVFYSIPVLQLQVQGDINFGDLAALVVVYASALVRIDMTELQPLLRKSLHDAEVRPKRGMFGTVAVANPNTPKVVYEIWDISRNTGRASDCVDGVISGPMALPLFETRQSKLRHFCAITAGPNNVFRIHRLSEDKSSTIASIIMNTILPAAWSTFTRFTRFFWQDSEEESQPLEARPQEFGRASLVTALRDEPRKGERIALSPSGTLAALTDSLGRILLIDTQALVVIRLWKGYRDAHCFFFDVPVNVTPPSHALSTSATNYRRKQDYILSLAIYTIRRGTLEVWELRNGPRLCIIKCGHDFSVIQPANPLYGSEVSSLTSYVPTELYILHRISGEVTAIKPQMPSN